MQKWVFYKATSVYRYPNSQLSKHSLHAIIYNCELFHAHNYTHWDLKMTTEGKVSKIFDTSLQVHDLVGFKLFINNETQKNTSVR